MNAISTLNDDRRKLWRTLALAVIIGVTVFRLIYLALWCPFDLAPDEAHYWDWSRNLDWSYYSKGPLIAWLIRGSIELFGSLSVSICGTEILAVRLPAVLCGSLLLAALYCLTNLIWKSERLAFFVVVGGLFMPATTAVSLISTIDAPFLCCWSWSLVVGHRALIGGRAWAWPVTGFLVGIGILAKYTMGLWLISAGMFLLFTPTHRKLLMRPGFWLTCVSAALCCLPILYWNFQNDWISFRHVATQAGVESSKPAGIRWQGPLEFFGGQFGLMLGYWFVVWLLAMIEFRPWKESRPEIGYLWWMSAPTVALFGLVSFKAGTQVNWPAAAYLSGMVLAIGWLHKRLNEPAKSYRRLARTGFTLTCILGLALTVIVHDTRMAHPLIAQIVGKSTDTDPYPIRKLDPTCRIRGWRYLASQVDEVRRELEREEGRLPEVAGLSWTYPGQLGFYCEGHPTVHSFGLAMGDRHSQYDLWHPNPLADAQAFRGKTFVFVGIGHPQLERGFESVDPPRMVEFRLDGRPIAGWQIWICRGFKGFDLSGPSGKNGRF